MFLTSTLSTTCRAKVTSDSLTVYLLSFNALYRAFWGADAPGQPPGSSNAQSTQRSIAWPCCFGPFNAPHHAYGSRQVCRSSFNALNHAEWTLESQHSRAIPRYARGLSSVLPMETSPIMLLPWLWLNSNPTDTTKPAARWIGGSITRARALAMSYGTCTVWPLQRSLTSQRIGPLQRSTLNKDGSKVGAVLSVPSTLSRWTGLLQQQDFKILYFNAIYRIPGRDT